MPLAVVREEETGETVGKPQALGVPVQRGTTPSHYVTGEVRYFSNFAHYDAIVK
jgi:hypothetical protein